jgi:outer membrane protein
MKKTKILALAMVVLGLSIGNIGFAENSTVKPITNKTIQDKIITNKTVTNKTSFTKSVTDKTVPAKNTLTVIPAKVTTVKVSQVKAETISGTENIVMLNVAVVDVTKIVASSSQITDLKNERQAKLNDLNSFVEKARADVAKEKKADKKKALEDSYNKELAAKKEALDKDYAQRVSDIDKNITGIIRAKAKALKYDLVLTKTSVLYGGTDITSEILKNIK